MAVMPTRKSKRNKKKAQLAIGLPPEKQYQAQVVEIVGDGAMAGVGVAEGRLVPVIIVDAQNRPDLHDVIQAHDSFRQLGEVTVSWGRPRGSEFYNRFIVSLLIHFVRPVDTYALILFDAEKAGILVDLIISSEYFYFQAGSPGDRIGKTLDAKRILVAAPRTGFEKIWEKIYYDALVNEFRSRGLDKKASSDAAEQSISSMREMRTIRVPSIWAPGEEGDS
jgi:hypothetical protein